MGKKVYELTLEIGHRASLLKSKLPSKPDYTHKWELTVRGAKPNIKLDCVQKVVFQLHESFDNPLREVTEAPFTLREVGYAGFEIPIFVHFKHKEKPQCAQFMHDLCLLIDKSNESFHYHKVKFTSPITRDFEKLLIKSGAQLLTVSSKKERSDSPPAKKQKSSSLIPSKDMNKQQHSPLLQSQTLQPQIPSSHHHKSSKHNSSHHSSKQSQSHHHQNHLQHPPQPQPTTQASKPSSREFIDIFGNPLAYNNGSSNTTDSSIGKEPISTSNPISSSHRSGHKEHSSKKSYSHKEHREHRQHKDHKERREHKEHKEHSKTTNNIIHTSSNNHFVSTVATPTPSNHNSSNHNSHSNQSTYPDNSNHSHSSKHNHNRHQTIKEEISKEDQFANDLQYIQTKISCLSDCDRLQKIVDIVEEAGEWYNLTPKKFEFDLKRLDKKTLSRIEKCLNY